MEYNCFWLTLPMSQFVILITTSADAAARRNVSRMSANQSRRSRRAAAMTNSGQVKTKADGWVAPFLDNPGVSPKRSFVLRQEAEQLWTSEHRLSRR